MTKNEKIHLLIVLMINFGLILKMISIAWAGNSSWEFPEKKEKICVSLMVLKISFSQRNRHGKISY